MAKKVLSDPQLEFAFISKLTMKAGTEVNAAWALRYLARVKPDIVGRFQLYRLLSFLDE